MTEKSKGPYVSCIKVNGIPILPPVITPDLCKELLKYKQQAIKLEKQLRKSREVKKSLDELFGTRDDRPSSQLTFGDNSHIEALNISEKPKEQNEHKKPHLSRDIIEVTQYIDSEMICSNIILSEDQDNFAEKHFCDKEKTDQYKNNDTEGADTSCLMKIIVGQKSQCSDNEILKPTKSPLNSPKPRLIRSNSYTLDRPSPILLAHLQKTSCLEVENTDSSNLASARNWTSLENNHTSFESSDFSSADTVYHKDYCDRHSDKSEISSSPDKSAKIIKEVKSPTIEVYQTDISVQQITVNTSPKKGLNQEGKNEKFLEKNPFEVFEPDSELLNVLKDIPEMYANQILELLRIQHLEQKERLERYDNLGGSPENPILNPQVFTSQSSSETIRKENLQGSGNSNLKNTQSSKTTSACENLIDLMTKCNANSCKPVEQSNVNSNRPHTTESCTNSEKRNSEKLRRSSTFSISPSQSLYYSITSDTEENLTVPSSPSVKLIDLESNNEEDLEIGILREKNGYWEGVMIHENAKNINCSRELFPEIDPVTMNVLKREWAASVIGAHIKGYLTRRLLKTEKVQSLIATIKDVLTCAVELHHSDNIDEKDVELHRRLINQLSAALYSFHDTFFDLSVPEQMLIIAADRQRRLEKLKRPPSGRNLSRSTSNKSTNSNKSTGSNKSTNSSKLNKSLPPSRSSSKHKLISGSPSLTKV